MPTWVVELSIQENQIHGGFMSSHSLIWAAVPHNSDGVVFQIRIARGQQRFHVSRRVLEDIFELERRAPDARQLQLFYACIERILAKAATKRSIAGADTVALLSIDFDSSSSTRDRWTGQAGARGAL
nr:hypothetical protein [Paraburkholderia sp. BCC1884]